MGVASGRTTLPGSGVSEALAEKVATLEVKELNERQRADLASVR